MILAIDPGNEKSAYVLLNGQLFPILHEKVSNEVLLDSVLPRLLQAGNVTDLAIEMVASYGMAVGKTVFDTCVWIGRFWEAGRSIPRKKLVYRMDEKCNLCHDSRAKDGNIRQALVDRFAPGAANVGKGTKKNPSCFYGFSADQWAAMAVGVTYADMMSGKYVRLEK